MTSATAQLDAATPTELYAMRQAILDSDYVDEASDLEQFKLLCTVEDRIVSATFATDADKLVGSKILSEINDASDFADQFKQKLFLRLHQF